MPSGTWGPGGRVCVCVFVGAPEGGSAVTGAAYTQRVPPEQGDEDGARAQNGVADPEPCHGVGERVPPTQ